MKISLRLLIFSSTLLISLILSPVTTVFAITVPAEINKSFTPIAIVAGGTSTLRVTVYNLNLNPLTNATWTDNLPAGITVENPPNVVNTCGGSVDDGAAAPLNGGESSFRLLNGTVPQQNPNGTPGDCYVEVDVTSTTPGNLINTIPAGALSSETIDGVPPAVPITNTTPASATLNVIGVQPPSLSKAFASNTIPVGGTSTLTITVTNNDTSYPLNELTLTDTLPTAGNGDVVVANPPNASLVGCGSGTLEDGGGGALSDGDTEIVLVDATVAAGGSCVISVDVTSLVQGAYTNTIPAGPGGPGSIQTREGVTNASPASAPLNVQAFNLTKSFATSPIPIGDTSVVTVTIQNVGTVDYSGMTLDDVLPDSAITPGAPDLEFISGTESTDCGSGTATIGTTTYTDDTLSLSGGTLSGGSSCSMSATVRARIGANPATYNNSIAPGDLTTTQGATNHAGASDNLQVTGLTVDKAFSPTTFVAGGTSTVTVTITNPSTTTDLTGVELTDSLPAGIVVETPPNPSVGAGCGPGSLDDGGGTPLAGGETQVRLTNGTILAGGSCSFSFDVTSPTPGSYTNNIPANSVTTDQGNPLHPQASADVDVITISVSKSYSPGTVSYPNASTLTITITNPVTGGALTGIALTDVLPAQLEIAPYPPATAPATSCNASSVPVLTAVAGTQTISLSNGSLPAAPVTATNCTITVPVRPLQTTSSGTYQNVIVPGDVTTNEGVGNGNTARGNLTVQAINLSKSFQYANFQAGGTNVLTITLSNPTTFNYTGVSFSDTLPTSPNSNLEFVPLSEGTTCPAGAASLSGGPPPRTLSFAGGTVPAGGSCTVTATVTTLPGVPDASYTNVIPASNLVTDQGPTNPNDVTADVDVYTLGEGVPSTKTFTPSTIDIFGNSRLRLEFTAPFDTDLTNFSFTDNLPTDVTVSNSTAPSATNCGAFSAPWPPAVGATTIAATSGTIAAGATCTLDVYVTSDQGTGPGIDYTNTITPPQVTNDQNRTLPGPISDTLTVQTPSTLDVRKTFYPDVVNPGGLSTLQIELENSNTAALVNVSLTDNLPGTLPNGVAVAPIPNASTTCGGTLTAATGTQLITLTGGTVPAQVGGVNGICTINVDVQGLGAFQTHTNTIPPSDVTAEISGNGSQMNSQGPASDDLEVADLDLEIVKGFDPQLVFGGASSEMSIILRNPNPSAELVNISFTDNMPPGEMILFAPPNFDASDCDPPSGPPAVLSGVAGGSTFTFSGGYLAPGDECTLTLDATLIVNGNRTNTIPAGAVTTRNGATNGTPTSATLTNLAGASLSKSFAPNPVASGLGSHSILTITIRTTATVAITGMGLLDNLPAGLQVAGGSAPAPTNNCGGTLSATPGAASIQLSGGSLPIGFDSCIMTIPVTGANPGVYTNTIPPSTLITDQGVTNIFPTSDTLTLTPYSLGNRVWFDTNNNGLLDGGEVGVQGVRVHLYRDDGATPGVFDAGDTYISFRSTDANGYYRFDDLGAGDYVVTIPADNFRDIGAGDLIPGDPLKGYLSSGTSVAADGTTSDSIGPDPDDDTDNDDNGVTAFSGNAVDYVSAQTVTLGPDGSEPTNDNDPTTNPETGEAVNDQSNRTVDFGFYRQELGNLIFQDINDNGIFDGSDTPLPGAIVQLFAGNGTTEINVGPDGIWGTADDASGGMVSNGSGNYLFSGLPEGNFVVKVLPTGYPSAVDNYNATAIADSANPNTNMDDNDNGVGTGAGTTSSNIVTLTPGNPGALTNNVVTAASGTTYNPTVDFGYVTIFGKSIVATDATHTVDPNVTIGEIITYEISMIVGPGPLNNTQLVDTPQAGLAFVDCLTINMPANVDSSTFGAGGAPIACDSLDGTTAGSNPLIANSGGTITFDFGTLSNNTGTNQTVTVRYTLIALDILANQDGDSLTNNVTWSYQGGSRTTNAPLVNIVEPQLTIDKDASPTTVGVGDPVTFTIDLAHAGISTADAFDVVIRDQIPSGLTFLPATLVIGGTATVNPGPYYDAVTNILTIRWDVIRLTETASVTFQATYLGPPPVVNSSNAEWSSLEIDPVLPGPPPIPQQLSPYNTSATERWYDPTAPAGVNNYVASDSVTINAGAGANQIPATGFAPGKVTVLPEQPSDQAYTDLSNLWLEIPSLGLKTAIAGVPRVGNTWDVQWLWDEAGYLQGTAFPTWAGNSVITAHVYLPDGNPGPFVDLHKLQWGDQVIIHAYGQRYIYEVRSNRKVSPQANVFKHEAYPWVTLITCQGYDEASDSYRYRIVVKGVQVRIERE